ncbi:MAG: Phosphoesterase PA-phosphatase releated protein [Candidatus Nomurabacteria bacterium GW2011_GWB1_35_20]|uniref:Phosphoesterase PA-phosphatase releated protein n=1 Tax=Candidatus Nomurabacteria bacterium GW2011_GWB1_35_20 TaxID=1618740 RepID=A0A0G0BRB2_9BACT|nr:MAG: Phosphoesterase PA-phosphatase releated protein [Candidatus Nomurabacteria bacterium GW2011_GWB1_35_20]
MNDSIFFFFYNLAHSSELFDQIVIFVADIFPYIVVILAFLFLIFYKKNFKETILIFFSSAFAWFLAYVLKFLFHTQRPFDLFPNVVSLFPAFALFFNHKKIGLSTQAGYLFIFFAFLIGASRIIAGVHFPVDILGGFVLGFFIAFFVKNR